MTTYVRFTLSGATVGSAGMLILWGIFGIPETLECQLLSLANMLVPGAFGFYAAHLTSMNEVALSKTIGFGEKVLEVA
ncbi:hypothetical protein [Glutamicibacter sp. JC586]|uniref:hypothetical protein n=1 Tax=Glutamicibacter sp. JC586 TaxID=2590552 RepID=UPI0013586734|nr:hypothetical protein [Glutamicibacter sp. JC586]